MRWKNTEKHYGFVAKTLHWFMALLFLGVYVSVYYRHWFTESKTPENWTALQLHLSLGVSIGVFVLLRLVWRSINTQPSHEPGKPYEHAAATLGHWLLYAVMIVMPLSGYLGTGVNTEFFFMFDIPKFEETRIYSIVVEQWLGMTFKAFEQPVDFFHKEIMGKWLVWMLIVGHISAALYHHFVRHDRTLKKMTVDR